MLFPEASLKPSAVLPKNYMEEPMPVAGVMEAQVNYELQSHRLSLLVVAGKGPSLILQNNGNCRSCVYLHWEVFTIHFHSNSGVSWPWWFHLEYGEVGVTLLLCLQTILPLSSPRFTCSPPSLAHLGNLSFPTAVVALRFLEPTLLWIMVAFPAVVAMSIPWHKWLWLWEHFVQYRIFVL